MKLIADVNFDMKTALSSHVRVHQPPIWLMMFRKKRRSSVCIFCKSALISAMAWSRRCFRTTQRILVEGTSRKSIMELSGRTENNRVVNFEGTPDMIGKSVDVEIYRRLPELSAR